MDNSLQMLEKEFQELIYNNDVIKNNILESLSFEMNSYTFKREAEFVNGITSDFIIYDNNNNIVAIAECKRADIGVTEYVRGVGQLFQYEYFQEENIKPKKYTTLKYSSVNNNILIIPSDFIKNTNLNIGKFKYPKSASILEVNTKNYIVRKIGLKELERLAEANDKLISICQYYVRDNRIFEHYIALQMIMLTKKLNISKNRTDFENDILRKIEVINNKNWRNAFITLSNLGFITNNMSICNCAISLINLNVYEYIDRIYSEYLYPFIDLIMDILKSYSDSNGYVTISNDELNNKIKLRYNNKDILYLTESENRYISSWLNILRDDFGCLKFEPRKNIRKIIYIPSQCTVSERINNIRKYSNVYKYINSFEDNKQKLIKEIL